MKRYKETGEKKAFGNLQVYAEAENTNESQFLGNLREDYPQDRNLPRCGRASSQARWQENYKEVRSNRGRLHGTIKQHPGATLGFGGYRWEAICV